MFPRNRFCSEDLFDDFRVQSAKPENFFPERLQFKRITEGMRAFNSVRLKECFRPAAAAAEILVQALPALDSGLGHIETAKFFTQRRIKVKGFQRRVPYVPYFLALFSHP